MRLSRSSAALVAVVSMPTLAATPTDWVTTIAPTDGYAGTSGTITFNDWGYKGPTGVGANDFVVGSGFDSARIGQIQQVVTTSPDWLTPDTPSPAGANILEADLASKPPYPTGTPLPDANMDGQVNFYKWGYTTPAGSTFNNMQIDKAGNYHVAKDDMSFGFYETFLYNNGSTIAPVDTGINFQPYAISDAQGWCGSVLVQNPNGVEQMAGQVTFDFAFDAYLFDKVPAPGVVPATQIVPDFVMRSYGDYVVDMDVADGTTQHYTGSAVGNNMNPETGVLDPAFHNQVSFLGAGVLPDGAWVLNDGTPDVQVVAEGTPGATWHQNSFAGFAFLLRADAERTLEFIAPDGHSDYVSTSTVPIPAAAWLFGSGVLALAGTAIRRSRQHSAAQEQG